MKLSTKLFSIMMLLSSLFSVALAAQCDEYDFDVLQNKNYDEIDGKRYYFGCLPDKNYEKLIEYLRRNSSNRALDILDSKIEEVRLAYFVGDVFKLTTPDDDGGDFCRWRFISNDGVLSDEEGIRRIEETGIIQLLNVKAEVNPIRILIWTPDFQCSAVNQLVATFQALKPGKVIFYVQNRANKNPGQHGCSCKPTIKKIVIDIQYHYCCLPPAPVKK